MASYFWEVQRIRLRAVEPADAEGHWIWNTIALAPAPPPATPPLPVRPAPLPGGRAG
jgi:hypothetical protein